MLIRSFVLGLVLSAGLAPVSPAKSPEPVVRTTQPAVLLTSRNYQRLSASTAAVYDDVVLVGAGQAISAEPVAVVTLQTIASDVSVAVTRIESGRRVKTPYEILSDDRDDEGSRTVVYMVSTPGQHWFDVVVTDYDRRILDRSEVELVIGPPGPGPGPDPDPDPEPEPDPDPDPEPDPEPPGPFNELAKRIAAIAKEMPADTREAIAKTCTEAADRMDRFDFKRVIDARDWVAENMPECDDEACKKFFELINEDAAGREKFGWQETINYYREIAKGVRNQ